LRSRYSTWHREGWHREARARQHREARARHREARARLARLVGELEVEVVVVTVDAEDLVGQRLGRRGVQKHADAVALDDLVAILRLRCVLDRELELAVDLFGGDAKPPDLAERVDCVVGDLQHP
jgi:hypothetical protein